MVDKKEKLGTADLHVHTNFSDGRYSPQKMVDYAQNHTTLDIIAITDHDTIKGALVAQKYAIDNNYRVKVIIGEEISTKEGHILALFLKKRIKPNLSVHETLLQIKKQDALAVMAHPLYHSRMRRKNDYVVDGVGLINLIKEKDFYHGIETINATPTQEKFNKRATYLNRTILEKSEIGGSDTHIIKGLGKGYTKFVGKSDKDLYQSIINKTTSAHRSKWEVKTLVSYAIRFAPNSVKVLGYTAIKGRAPKRPQIVHCKL